MRDAASYCSIILDDNNRKPIARLHFDGRAKFLTLFDAEKNRMRVDIEDVEDIYDSAEVLRDVVTAYLGG